MRTTLAVLVAGLVGFGGVLGVSAQEKGGPKIEGTYVIVAGVKDGEKAKTENDKKETVVTIDAKTILLGEKGKGFVMSYKIDASAKPAKVDMVILEAPEAFADAKGAKGYGIVSLKGGVLKLAYGLDAEKRPTDFSGKSGFAFEMKKK